MAILVARELLGQESKLDLTQAFLQDLLGDSPVAGLRVFLVLSPGPVTPSDWEPRTPSLVTDGAGASGSLRMGQSSSGAMTIGEFRS